MKLAIYAYNRREIRKLPPGGLVVEAESNIAKLRDQVSELSTQLQSPEKLEEVLLEACSGLLAVLEHLQSSPIAAQNEAQEIDLSIQNNVRGILEILDQSRKTRQAQAAEYQSVQHQQSELSCRIRPNGDLLCANDAFLSYFAFVPGLKPGVNLAELIPTSRWTSIQQNIQALTPENPIIRLDYSLQLPDGSSRWLQWTALGLFNHEDALEEIQVIAQDTTAHKQDELAALQHNRELRALHNATAALLTTLDPEALLSRILDAAISAVPAATKGMIHLIAADTGQLEMRASVGYSDPRIVRIRVPGVINYVARSVHERKPLLIHHIHTDPSLAAGPFQQVREVNSAIVAPLILKTQVLGALSLESPQISAFEETDLRLLVSFAATATAAIHNAHLHAEVQKLAITDSLTGLYNRRGFYELGQREVERSRRYRRPLVAIMLDIDHFKSINDMYGHTAGDQVLQNIAKRCTESLRRIDIIGRLGGDEFTILLPETDMFTASGVAERVRMCIADRPVSTEKTPLNVSISLGVARATATTPDLDVLISRADKAMYIAKREGRNRVEYG